MKWHEAGMTCKCIYNDEIEVKISIKLNQIGKESIKRPKT